MPEINREYLTRQLKRGFAVHVGGRTVKRVQDLPDALPGDKPKPAAVKKDEKKSDK